MSAARKPMKVPRIQSAKPEMNTFADGSFRPTQENSGLTFGTDQTTAAHSRFLKSERATSGLPYKKYWATGKDVKNPV